MAALTAEAAHNKFRGKVPWLRLSKDDQGNTFLGCDICMSNVELHSQLRGKVSTLASGRFVPGKYLYMRTFDEHEATACHQASLPTATASEENHEGPHRQSAVFFEACLSC